MTAAKPEAPLCVRHRRTDPRPCVPGTQLCVQCHRLYLHTLSEIADLWPSLTTSVTRKAVRDDSGRGSKGGHSEVGDMWNPAATVVILDVTDYVDFLLRIAVPADKRLPKLQAGREKVLQNLRVIIRYYGRYLSHHDTLGASLLGEALEYLAGIKSAIDATFVRRIALPNAVCDAEATADDTFGELPVLCGGQLVAVIAPDGSGRTSTIKCSNDPRHDMDANLWILYRGVIASE